MRHSSKGISLSLLQINPASRDKNRGTQKTLDLIRKTAKKRPGIVILPEIWSGGFEYPDVGNLANKTPEILQELSNISKEYKTMIIGSLPEKRSGKLYNTAAIIDNGRIIGRYRKQRLFSLMQEDRHFSTCRSPRIFTSTYGTIHVAICFDLRFSELFTSIQERDAWLLIVPAQWPLPRCEHWENLLIARAIESQVYVAGCNRVGKTGETRFCGNSLVVDPWGVVTARGGRRAEVITTVVHPSKVRKVRKEIPMKRRVL